MEMGRGYFRIVVGGKRVVQAPKGEGLKALLYTWMFASNFADTVPSRPIEQTAVPHG